MRTIIRIGTRSSPLALRQARWVKDRLEQHWPALRVELVPVKTSGDRFQNISLSRIGGKGLFVKEIEEALQVGRVDLAVHSVKDVPAFLPAGLTLSVIPQREDPRDVLITSNGETLDELPEGTRVGTSSLRRQALLLHLRPDLHIAMLRGNVETRLRKQRDGEVDATILATAGLKRLGLMPARSHILDEQVFVPAVGQGALGIETRVEAETEALLRPLHHAETALAVTAERAFLGRMGGSCRTPLAALSTARTEGVTLVALIASPDGQTMLRGQEHGPPEAAEQLGVRLAERLLAQGGNEILARLEQEG